MKRIILILAMVMIFGGCEAGREYRRAEEESQRSLEQWQESQKKDMEDYQKRLEDYKEGLKAQERSHEEFEKALKAEWDAYEKMNEHRREGLNKVKIRMKKVEVEKLMGEPDDINRTVLTGRVHEQWVYENKLPSRNDQWYHISTYYLYFDNGILTAWQD